MLVLFCFAVNKNCKQNRKKLTIKHLIINAHMRKYILKCMYRHFK